ncbi:epoxide hydrolase family protein [Novosphingobium sp. 9U]|uniref:epoxide hydrolase family protein n=1 Tax=Novosphingobium sp. 9U TaxID=2653158 RepID=UPI0012EF01A3|nr:epoxide hydrolase family protein [Novosphingobium sp. 9U]VWX51172.1 Putative epoxide hydrolase [Novosphingobium sp. 9U]
MPSPTPGEPAPIAARTEDRPGSFILPSSDDQSIRPFEFHASDQDLADLKGRILATRWPDRETVPDDPQGVQLATMQKLAAYWADEYDWRKCEARLNALPNFITEIDGLDVHFIHVRSRHPDALPVIITHGWPGSIVEQLKIVDPLVNPTAHGGSAADAFDVVIPSLPGYGFSARPPEAGWNPPRIVNAWLTLMKRLGYTRFAAQGGDWGALITEIMGAIAPPELVAIHTNMASTAPPEVFEALRSGKGPPDGLSNDERWAYERLDLFFTHGVAYANQMGQRPQTLYGIADSPVELAAWFLDHDISSYRMIARAFDGADEGLTRDDVLDNITIAWLTNTAISGARLYWEALPRTSAGFGMERNNAHFFEPIGVRVPTAVSAFPDELNQAPESWAQRAYPQLTHYNRLPKGGHFAAFEQPGYLVDEMRAGFSSVR